MEHLRDLADISLAESYLTIGSFDGVHYGHQVIIRSLVSAAKPRLVPAVVLTFHPHPAVVLGNRPPIEYLSSPDEKATLIGELGADYVVTHKFDATFSLLGPGEFLDLVSERLNPLALWVGPDFGFGRERRGDIAYLQCASAERGFELHVVPQAQLGGQVVRSSRIREAVRRGDVVSASRFLGRPFALSGRVARGDGRGQALGFPTVNLSVWRERLLPGSGVYACVAEFEGRRALAVTNIGLRPTFDEGTQSPIVEAHLLDFEGDLYAKEVSLVFVARLRAERRFHQPEALIDQIQRDIRQARRILEPEFGS